MISTEKTSVFFSAKVSEAAASMNYPLPPASGMYLADLMDSTVTVPLAGRAVAIDFATALNGSTSLRVKHFKALGDNSLILSGIWPGSLVRKPVKIDYYVMMGRIGYANVASIFRTKMKDDHFASLFEDLDENFEIYREIMERASGAGAPKTMWQDVRG